MTELKPCPFCGGKDINIDKDEQYYHKCWDCGATGPWGKTEEEAIKLWNTRHEE